MKIYTQKMDISSSRDIVCDDMILTKDLPTTAGSKMLDGYVSLFEAEVLTRLKNAGYNLKGKASVGEFAIDLVGETYYKGVVEKDGKLVYAPSEILKENVMGVVCLDVNGSVRRGSAQNGLVSVKPTYGTVSRYGVIPVACSGETVSVVANNGKDCKEILTAISGYDCKDGTSIADDVCKENYENSKPIKKVAILKNLWEKVDAETNKKLDSFKEILAKNNVEIVEIDDQVLTLSNVAWNILFSAELCNNVSRYDGVKYGYRAQRFANIDELYTNSRTEAFGELLKTAILFGSDTLSTENYMKVYDKALRTRRVIVEKFNEIFKTVDAVIMPACSKMSYTLKDIEENKHFVFEENKFTAPASITGLPCVVTGGVQIVGKAFSEYNLLALSELR